MLSIGKLAAGQADYYLDQAAGRVTRAGSVGSDVEDYYIGGPEAVGYWFGTTAERLGVRGPVDRDGLTRRSRASTPRRAAATAPRRS